MNQSMVSDGINESLEVQTIFDGKDIAVRACFDSSDSPAIVSFSPRRNFTNQKGPRKVGFGEEMFQKNRVSFACFISKSNHWWQTDEMEQAASVLRPYLRNRRRVSTYGVSMGGYGALLMADKLEANQVLAFSPQVDISGALPLHPVWQKDLSDVRHVFGADDVIPSSRVDVDVVLDSGVSTDVLHARKMSDLRSVRRIVTPLSGHSSSMFLAEIGLLKQIVLDAVHGKLDVADTRRRIRERRSNNPVWLNRVAARVDEKGGGRSDLRGLAVKILLEDDSWDQDTAHIIISRHLNSLQDTKLERRATIESLLAHKIHCYSAHISLSEDYLRSEKVKKAVQHAKQARQLRPRKASPYVALAKAMLAIENFSQAEKFLEKAISRKGASRRELSSLRNAFERSGKFEQASRIVVR